MIYAVQRKEKTERPSIKGKLFESHRTVDVKCNMSPEFNLEKYIGSFVTMNVVCSFRLEERKWMRLHRKSDDR